MNYLEYGKQFNIIKNINCNMWFNVDTIEDSKKYYDFVSSLLIRLYKR